MGHVEIGAGKGPFGNLIELEPSRILSYEILQLALGIVLLFAGGKFVSGFAEDFKPRQPIDNPLPSQPTA